MNVLINKNRHIGDAIAIINTIYNISLEKNIKFNIYGAYYIKELTDVFNYCNLKYCGTPDDVFENNSSISEFLHINKTNVPFLSNKHFFIDNKIQHKIKKIEMPKNKIKLCKKNENILFQFDSRTIHENKIKINDEKINQMLLLKHENCNKFGIGGKDTKPYTNKQFILGNIKEISESLNCCKYFIGIDSGISHIAGTLGVNGLVLINHLLEQHCQELKMFYQLYYTSFEIKTICEVFPNEL
jgi:hypothetical protein